MLALAEVRAGRCKGCGQDLADTTAHEGMHEWRVRRMRCHGCAALEVERLKASKVDKPESLPGARLMWVEKVR